MKRVVVGVDGSKQSRRALQRAVFEAELRGARVDVVHVFEPPRRPLAEEILDWPLVDAGAREPEAEAKRRIDSATRPVREELQRIVAQEMAGREGVEVRRLVIEDGHPAEALMKHAADAELLVIGTRGSGGFRGMLLGSVAQQCMQHARCAVLVLPPEHPR